MNIILIEKNETIIEKNIKTFDVDKLYSVCGYRSNKDFQKLYEWEFDKNIYELYGKKIGKSDKENKYNFPNEKDKLDKLDKYYGTLCIIKKDGSITIDEWNIFYMSFTTKDKYREIINDEDDVEDIDETKYINKYVDDELTYEEYEEE
jgi:hypothetical protein